MTLKSIYQEIFDDEKNLAYDRVLRGSETMVRSDGKNAGRSDARLFYIIQVESKLLDLPYTLVRFPFMLWVDQVTEEWQQEKRWSTLFMTKFQRVVSPLDSCPASVNEKGAMDLKNRRSWHPPNVHHRHWNKLLFSACTHNFIFKSERRPMIPSCESYLVHNMQGFTLSQTNNARGIFFPESHVATRHRSFHALSLVARAALVQRLGDGKIFVHQQRNPRSQKVVVRVKLGDGDSTTTRTTASNVKLGDGDSTKPTTEALVEAEEQGGLSEGLKARIYLFLVPFMWGTYGPALRFIYSQPLAPSASIITLSRKGGPSNFRCKKRM